VPLDRMGASFFLGAICWTLVDPARPVFDETPAAG
jgi:hypothetical protein